MSTPVQICYGSMSIGRSTARVGLNVITPNSQLKGMPAKCWESKAPIAKSAAHSSITGCGEWCSHSLLANGITYLQITCSSSHIDPYSGAARTSVATVVVRVHDAGTVLSIHAKIPHEQSSTIIDGMVHCFQGRGDILTPEEIINLSLNVPQKNLGQADVEARFRILDYKVDAELRRKVTVKKTPDGKIEEELVTTRRRNVRIRRR